DQRASSILNTAATVTIPVSVRRRQFREHGACHGLALTAPHTWSVIATEGERTGRVIASPHTPCRLRALDSCPAPVGGCVQIIHSWGLPAWPRGTGAGGVRCIFCARLRPAAGIRPPAPRSSVSP